MMVRTRPKTLALQLPDRLSLRVTPEQFAALTAANRELRLERTATGELIVNPPTGSETGYRNWNLAGELYLWWRNAGEPGKAFDSSSGFELPNGANRSPDVAWVSQDRWDALTPEQRKGFAPLCPDFVVELCSESDTPKDLRAKIEEYIENGAMLGWLIDPKNKRVEIYRLGQRVEVLENPSTLSGEGVLPGFTLNLNRVFA
jgi:Uma2 family endonuclease